MTDDPAEVVLQDDAHRRVVRVGDTVRRPQHPWSASVHALLRHLHEVGFNQAPRVLGIDDQGREVLEWLDGTSGPGGWAKVVDERGLRAMARLLRDYHQAVAGFRPVDGAWAARSRPPADGEIICHGDFGPWNLVWRGTQPVGVLDWDYAWPDRPVFDVAYALEYVAPFRDDAECLRWLAYDTPPDRRHRLEVFATAYGLTRLDGLVEEVIDQQRAFRDKMLLLADTGHQPQVDWVAQGVADTVAARIRWSEEHRDLFA